MRALHLAAVAGCLTLLLCLPGPGRGGKYHCTGSVRVPLLPPSALLCQRCTRGEETPVPLRFPTAMMRAW